MAIVLICGQCSKSVILYDATDSAAIYRFGREAGWIWRGRDWLCPKHATDLWLLDRSRQQVLRKLVDELDLASDNYLKANREQLDLVKNDQRFLESSDGKSVISQSAEDLKAVFEQYHLAEARYRDYVERGYPPMDERSDET